MSALKYWVWLSSVSGIGPVAAAHLLRHFGSPEKIYLAGATDYKGIEGIRTSEIARLVASKDISKASKALSSCDEIGCRVITLQDAEYPDRLRNIFNAPVVLYILGRLPEIDDEPLVAVVGTRDCTPYGLNAADSMGYELSRNGFTIVTGLAKGIDSAAARGALRAGGRVIGVIGSGLDIVYPAENKSLFNAVSKTGAIISEYPPGVPAVKTNFPARNRIISGISLGVAVIEAPKRSGALITASRALEQGRDVFALPGNVDARSCEGSNALLREGAIPVLSAQDVIDEYDDLYPARTGNVTSTQLNPTSVNTISPSDDTEHDIAAETKTSDKKEIDNTTSVDYIDLDKMISDLIGDEKIVAETVGSKTKHVDEVIVDSGLSAQQVLSALTMLEIKGFNTSEGSGSWRLKVENYQKFNRQ